MINQVSQSIDKITLIDTDIKLCHVQLTLNWILDRENKMHCIAVISKVKQARLGNGKDFSADIRPKS